MTKNDCSYFAHELADEIAAQAATFPYSLSAGARALLRPPSSDAEGDALDEVDLDFSDEEALAFELLGERKIFCSLHGRENEIFLIELPAERFGTACVQHMKDGQTHLRWVTCTPAAIARVILGIDEEGL